MAPWVSLTILKVNHYSDCKKLVSSDIHIDRHLKKIIYPFVNIKKQMMPNKSAYYLPRLEILQRPPSVCPSVCLSVRPSVYIFFSIFQVFFAFHAISNITTKFWCKKKSGGGGGGVFYFFFKQFFLISHFMVFSTLKKYWKVPLHLLVKWEVVSPNSREGQLESISIISSIPLFWFSISNVGVVWGGGGCNVFLTFYAISKIFLYAGNII